MSNVVTEAIAKFGSQKKLAAAFNVSYQAIQQWQEKGVPLNRVVEFERITGIPRQRVCPELYEQPPLREAANA